jgi:hypothetical protein
VLPRFAPSELAAARQDVEFIERVLRANALSSGVATVAIRPTLQRCLEQATTSLVSIRELTGNPNHGIRRTQTTGATPGFRPATQCLLFLPRQAKPVRKAEWAPSRLRSRLFRCYCILWTLRTIPISRHFRSGAREET